MDQKLKTFSKKYECQIKDSGKVYARYSLPLWVNPTQSDLNFIEHNTERLYTIEIPESRLATLVEMEDSFFNPSQVYKHGKDLFDTLLEKEREELTIRKRNPAVQKAYEQYRIMLGLSGYTPKI